MNKTKYLLVLKGIFVIYFASIILIQIYNQGYFKCREIENLKRTYFFSLFEQNWSMFSPNPPMGNRYFLMKFGTKQYESGYIAIHNTIKSNGFNRMFSIDQRITKYLTECYNSIMRAKNKKIDIEKSHGLESIINYSHIILSKQNKFLNQIDDKDSIYVRFYLVNERLHNDIYENKKYVKTYFKLNKIYLDRDGK